MPGNGLFIHGLLYRRTWDLLAKARKLKNQIGPIASVPSHRDELCGVAGAEDDHSIVLVFMTVTSSACQLCSSARSARRWAAAQIETLLYFFRDGSALGAAIGGGAEVVAAFGAAVWSFPGAGLPLP